MSTDLEAAVARLKRDLDAIAAETSGAKEARGDVRLLLADWETAVRFTVSTEIAEVFRGSGNGVWVVLVDDLTLVEAAPAKERHLDDRQGWEVERDTLKAENARLREALQAWVNDSPNECCNQHDRMLYAKCLALGVQRKETP